MGDKYFKTALKTLKETHGPPNEEFVASSRDRMKVVKGVEKVMKTQHLKTIPEIAEATNYPTDMIFNAINFLMKWNGLRLINKRGDYPQYSFEVDEE